MDGNHLRVSRS